MLYQGKKKIIIIGQKNLCVRTPLKLSKGKTSNIITGAAGNILCFIHNDT